MNDLTEKPNDSTPVMARRAYLNLISDRADDRFGYLELADQLELVEAYLAASSDPDGWLIEAYAEQDLHKIDLRYLISCEPIPEAEYIRARKQAICNYFKNEIDDHIEKQYVTRW